MVLLLYDSVSIFHMYVHSVLPSIRVYNNSSSTLGCFAHRNRVRGGWRDRLALSCNQSCWGYSNNSRIISRHLADLFDWQLFPHSALYVSKRLTFFVFQLRNELGIRRYIMGDNNNNNNCNNYHNLWRTLWYIFQSKQQYSYP